MAPTPTVPAPDDAFQSFKTAEGTLTQDQGANANAAAQLAAAQKAKTDSDTTVAADVQAFLTAGANLIAAVQAAMQAVQPVPPAPTT